MKSSQPRKKAKSKKDDDIETVKKTRKRRTKKEIEAANAVLSIDAIPTINSEALIDDSISTAEAEDSGIVENFYISCGLATVKVEEPLMLVFKNGKNEIGFERKDNTHITVKIHEKSEDVYSKDFTYKDLAKLLRNKK